MNKKVNECSKEVAQNETIYTKIRKFMEEKDLRNKTDKIVIVLQSEDFKFFDTIKEHDSNYKVAIFKRSIDIGELTLYLYENTGLELKLTTKDGNNFDTYTGSSIEFNHDVLLVMLDDLLNSASNYICINSSVMFKI